MTAKRLIVPDLLAVSRRALAAALCLQFSVGPLVLSAARADAPETEQRARLSRIETTSGTVDAELSSLSLLARNPNTLSTGKVDRAEVPLRLERLENTFAAWSRDIEEQMEVASADFEDPTAELDQKFSILLYYFGKQLLLASCRAYLGLPLDDARWTNARGLLLPAALVRELNAGRGEDWIRAAGANPDSPVLMTRQPDGRYSFRLSPRVTARLATNALANHASRESFLQVFRQLVAGALYDQWAALRSAQGAAAPTAAEMPAEVLALVEAKVQAAQGAQLRRDLREALVLGWGQIQDQPPAVAFQLSTPVFTDSFLPLATPAVRADLWVRAQRAESSNIANALRDALESAGFPLSAEDLSPGNAGTLDANGWGTLLVRAKFAAVAPVLGDTLSRESSPPDSPRAAPAEGSGLSDELLRQIDSTLKLRAGQMSPALLAAWLTAAQQQLSSIPRRARDEYNAQLVRESRRVFEIFDAPGEASAQIAVNAELLLRVVLPALRKDGARPGAEAWLKSLAGKTQWPQARALYAQIIAKLGAPGASESSARDAAVLRQGAALLGFDQDAASPAPRLTDLPLSKEQLAAYREALRAQELPAAFLLRSSKSWGNQALYIALAQAPSNAPVSAWINEALTAAQQTLTQELRSIAEARDVGELATWITRSPLTLALMQEGFPMFDRVRDEIMDELSTPSAARKTWEEVEHTYLLPMLFLMPAFIFKMGAGVLRQSRPLLRAINRAEASLSPQLAGYMLATLPLIFADLGVQAADHAQNRAQEDAIANGYYSTVAGQSFFDAFDLADARDRSGASRAVLGLQVALLGAFTASPLLVGGTKRFLLRAADRWRLRQFAELGFARGSFSWKAEEIVAQATRQTQAIDANATFGAAQKTRAKLRVAKAQQSLQWALTKQNKYAARVFKDFAAEFEALGLPRDAASFDLGKIDAAVRAARARVTLPDLSAAQKEAALNLARRAEKSAEELQSFIFSEWQFALPGPLQMAAYRARGWVGVKATSPEISWVRDALIKESFGFRFAPAAESARGTASGAAGARAARDYYEVLGLRHGADGDAIRAAFRERVMKWHPDRHSDDPTAPAKLQEVLEAMETLGDDVRRADYDSFFARRAS